MIGQMSTDWLPLSVSAYQCKLLQSIPDSAAACQQYEPRVTGSMWTSSTPFWTPVTIVTQDPPRPSWRLLYAAETATAGPEPEPEPGPEVHHREAEHKLCLFVSDIFDLAEVQSDIIQTFGGS